MHKLINKWKYKKVKSYYQKDYELNYHIENKLNGVFNNLDILLQDDEITEEEYLFMLVLIDFYNLDRYDSYVTRMDDDSLMLNGKCNNFYVDTGGLLNTREDIYSIFLEKDEIKVYVVRFEGFENKELKDNVNTIKEYIRKNYE